MDTTLSTTAHTPRSLRTRLGLSLAQVSKRTERTSEYVSVTTLVAIERGEDVTTRKVRSTASALEVEPWVLLAAHEEVRRQRDGNAAKAREAKSRKRARRAS